MPEPTTKKYELLGLDKQDLKLKTDNINSKFENSTSEQELRDLLKQIDGLTTQCQDETSHYITHQQKKYQQDITSVELSRAKLADTLKTTNDLITMFSNSNDIGSSLTVRLKSLDREIARVEETTDYVSKTKLLKNNINQAVYALEHNNYELAANCLHTIKLEVPQLLIDGQYAINVIPSTDIPELPQPMIEKLTKQLIDIIKTKFDEAASNKDIPQLTKFFQLFPLIGEEEVGLKCYSKFIRQIITDTSRNLIQSISSGSSERSRKNGLYSRCSMQLFENISMMLSQHAPLINKYYGSTYPDAIPFVIERIQHEIDSQVGLITDTFYDETRMNKILQDIKLYDFPILKHRLEPEARASGEFSRQSFEDNELVTIVEAGDLLSDFASIFNYWSLYCKFISTRYFDTRKSDNVLKVPKLLLESNFTKKINSKYLHAFELIFKFYFKRSLEKAITIEDLPSIDPFLSINSSSKYPEQAPCSSVIEDFTLVLNTCLKSVIDSGQIEALKTFINEAMNTIKNDLLNGYLIRELNENLPRYNSALYLINPRDKLLADTMSPKNSRGATPVPEASGIGFFKGAQSALGNVVGGAVTTANPAHVNNPKLVNFVLYLNTIAVGQEYLTKILDNITRNDGYYIKNCFPFGDDANIVKNILKLNLLDPFTASTNKIIQDSLINFYNQLIKAKLLTIISEFLNDVDEAFYHIYSSSVLNDSTSILEFTNSWRSLILPYKQVFQHNLIYNKLHKLIILNLANMIEKRVIHIMKKFKINELGALKLEKDISGFIAEVCEDNYEMREKFVRVAQLVLLVGMSDDEYEDSISQHDEDYGINWIFTPSERKQYRSLRF